MKRVIAVVLTCIAVMGINRLYAADNATVFGVEDDIWVGGTGGTWNDADAEIKGFSIFGATDAVSAPNFVAKINPGIGGVVISSAVQVGFSGSPMSYFVSSVTVNGYGVFTSTVQIPEGYLQIGTGVSGKVLRSHGNGFVFWDDPSAVGDNLGNHTATKNLDMATFDIAGVGKISASSITLSNADGIMSSGQVTASSFTATNAAGISAAQLKLGNGIVLSSASVAQLGGVYISTSLYTVGISSFASEVYMRNNQKVYLSSASFIYMDGGATNQVLKKDAGGALKWANDDSGAGSITGTPNRLQKIDNSGTGLVDAGMVQSGNGDASGLTVISSSFSVNNLALFKSSVTINGDGAIGLNVAGGTSTFTGNVAANSSVNIGDGTASDVTTVNGSGTSGTRFVVFQSNGSNVAWMRKK